MTPLGIIRFSGLCRLFRNRNNRHTHCVHCLRRWVLEGADLAAYLPILKTYMGHYSFKDMAHYLRLSAELYPDIIAKSEQAFGDIIPTPEGWPNETD